MRSLLFASSIAGVLSALPTGSLVGVFHAPGDVTSCSLLAFSLPTGSNSTLSTDVPACKKLTTNFPSFSAYDGTSLLLAISSGPSVFAIDPMTGATTAELGDLPPNDDANPLLGLVAVEGAGVLTATSIGLYNSTSPGPSTLLVSFVGKEVFASAFVVASFPSLYVCDEYSAAIVAVDLQTMTKKTIKGLPTSIGTLLLNPTTLLQEKGYVLYTTSLATGKSTKVLQIENGPGYPRTNGLAGNDYWWWFDFANLHLADLRAHTTQIIGGDFTAASRAMGFPVYIPK